MEDKNIFDCQEYVIQMMFYNKEVSINTGINVCPQGDKGGFMNTCASTLETTVEWNEKFLPRETRQGAALGGGGAFELGWSQEHTKGETVSLDWVNITRRGFWAHVMPAGGIHVFFKVAYFHVS